jgi:hypothetical protein
VEVYPKRYEIDIIEDSDEPYSYLVEDCDGDWVQYEDYQKLLDYAVRCLLRHASGNYTPDKIRHVILESIMNQDQEEMDS